MKLHAVFLLLAVLAVAAPAAELLFNGGFELPLDSGWTLTVEPPQSTHTVRTSANFVLDPDRELLVYKRNRAVVRLDQQVGVDYTDLFFGCLARFATREADTGSTNWAAAGVAVRYLDSAGSELGVTRVASLSPHCPWQSDSVTRVIRADGAWRTWRVSLAAELESLPGVERNAVRAIGVAVFDTVDGSAPGDCEAWVHIDDVTLFDTLVPGVEVECVRVDDGGNGVLDPEETGDVLLRLRNTGRTLWSVRGALSTAYPHLTVLDGLAGWGNIAPGETANCNGDRFRLRAGRVLPPFGDTAVLDIVLTANLMIVDTLRVPIPIGDSVSLPTGPDAHGQFAWDDGDLAPTTPVFNWVEVNGRGTRLDLTDDQTVTIDIPAGFQFRRHGRAVTQLSICSNGWVAPGVTTRSDYANTALPNAQMPPGLMAANWDDLHPGYGSGVWWFHDTVFDRLVVEWDSVGYYGNPTLPDKFEIVILGRSWPAPSDDNTVVFQYLTAFGFLSSTVGVQDIARTSAIQYCLDDAYARTAASIAPGRAIAFHTAWQTAEAEPAAGDGPGFMTGPALFRERLEVRPGAGWTGPVKVGCFDLAGRMVAQAESDGVGCVVFDGRRLAAGVYFVVATDGASVRRLKVVRAE